jgi:hypothetical protein
MSGGLDLSATALLREMRPLAPRLAIRPPAGSVGAMPSNGIRVKVRREPTEFSRQLGGSALS